MEYLKSLTPIFTFFLGVLLIPYIESRKEKTKISAIIDGVKIELADEYSVLIDSIQTANTSINTRRLMPKNFEHIQLGKKFHLMLLEDNLPIIYSSLNNEYRLAFKNIILLQNQINIKFNFIVENWKIDNIKCRAAEESMLYSMLSLYYVISKIITEKERFKFPRIPNEEIVAHAAESLKIPQPLLKFNR